MRMMKILAGIVVVLVIVVVGIAVYIANLDANEYREEIAAQAKAATGRELTIGGTMDFKVSLTPALVVEGLALNNADWGSEEKMLRLKRLEVRVGLLPLLSGNLDIQRVILIEPDILLETDKTGRGNWVFETAGETSKAEQPASETTAGGGAGPVLPTIGEVRIEGGRVIYKDGVSGQQTTLTGLDLTGRAASPSDPLELTLSAVANDIPVSLVGQIGPLAVLLDGKSRASLDLTAEALGLKVTARGTMAAPNLDAAIDVSASDLAGLKPLAGDAIPTGQALKLSAQLAAGPDAVKLSGLSLTLGESDLSGDVSVALTGKRPGIEAKLQSRQLNLAALLPTAQDGAAAGGGSGGRDAPVGPAATKVFPSEPLPLDGMQAVDATVSLTVARLLVPNLELTDTAVDLSLKDGRLRLTPLLTKIAGSPLEASVDLDGAAATPTLALDLKALKFDVGRMLQETGTTDLLEGSGDIAVTLKGKGASVAAIMASLDGSTSVLMGEGRMRTQAFDTFVGGLSAVMGSLFSKQSEWTVLNCVANRFEIKKGIATSQVMLFDTEYSTVAGEGDVNLGQETLALTVTPQSKSPTLNLSVPVKIGGTFLEPTFRPDELAVARRVGGLLGATLFPPAALLSLGDLGSGEDNPCLKIASGEVKPAGSEAAPSPAGEAAKALEQAKEDPKKAIEDVGKGLKKLFGN